MQFKINRCQIAGIFNVIAHKYNSIYLVCREHSLIYKQVTPFSVFKKRKEKKRKLICKLEFKIRCSIWSLIERNTGHSSLTILPPPRFLRFCPALCLSSPSFFRIFLSAMSRYIFCQYWSSSSPNKKKKQKHPHHNFYENSVSFIHVLKLCLNFQH